MVDMKDASAFIKEANPLFFTDKANFRAQAKKPATCRDCQFYDKPFGWEDAPSYYHGTGEPEGCDILIILPGPTQKDVADDTRNGIHRPFTGPSWWLYQKILSWARSNLHYRIKSVYACPCRGNKKTPTKVIKTCGQRYLQQKIREYQPKAILSLDILSAKALGFSPKTMVSIRGKIDTYHDPDLGDIPIVFTYDPALYFFPGKQHKALGLFTLDLQKAGACSRGEIIPEDLDYWKEAIEIPDGSREIIDFCKRMTDRTDIKLAFDIETTGVCHWYDEDHVDELHGRIEAPRDWSDKVLAKITKDGPPSRAKVLALSFAWGKDKAAAFDVRSITKKAWAAIKELLESSTPKIAHNAKFDMAYLQALHGIRVANLAACTLLNMHLVDENREGYAPGEYGLKKLIWDYDPGFGGYEERTGVKVNIARLEEEMKTNKDYVLLYAAIDSLVTWRLFRRQVYLLNDADIGSQSAGTLRKNKLFAFSRDFLPGASETIADMEVQGVRLDMDRVGYLLRVYQKLHVEETARLKDELSLMGRQNLNWRSAQQLESLLFDDLGLTPLKKTKGGARSTDAATLEALEGEHIIVTCLMHMKKLEKLQAFLVGWKTLAKWVGDHWRLYPSLNLDGTVTGRLSTSDPNVQQIPDWKKFSRLAKAYDMPLSEFDLKTCFIPSEGMVFVYADYSQQEVRVLANYCRVGKLPEALAANSSANLDMHCLLTALGEDLPYDEVYAIYKDESHDRHKEIAAKRKGYKNVVFTLAYGGTEHTLQERYGIPLDKGKELFDTFYERFPEVKGYIDASHAMAQQKAYVTTEYGRRRHFPILEWKTWDARSFRQAQNSRIQGTASDICLEAVIGLNRSLRSLKARVAITVHDSIIGEVPIPRVKEGLRMFHDVMVKAPMAKHAWLKVPVVIDLAIGMSWGSLVGVSATDESEWDNVISQLT